MLTKWYRPRIGHQMQAAAFLRNLTRYAARGWPRAARFCLVLFACLSQLSVTTQHRLVPGVAASATGYSASHPHLGFTPARSERAQASVPCAAHRSATSGSNDPAPCHGDCPFCPCCATLHAAIGILPPEMSRTAYARPFSKLGPPPLRLGSSERFAIVAGQPRAPPVLI
jgi:hypothetical protein